MSKIMHEWGHIADADTVDGQIERVMMVDVGVDKGSALSPLLLFAIVVDVVTNEIKEGMLQEIL